MRAVERHEAAIACCALLLVCAAVSCSDEGEPAGEAGAGAAAGAAGGAGLSGAGGGGAGHAGVAGSGGQAGASGAAGSGGGLAGSAGEVAGAGGGLPEAGPDVTGDVEAPDVSEEVGDAAPETGADGDAAPYEASASCTPPQLAQAWVAMITAPIVPLTGAANLDLNGPASAGLTLEDAEKINCQSAFLGDYFADATFVNSWGDNAEVMADYLPADHIIQFLNLTAGYVGNLSFAATGGAPSYVIAINSSITKEGADFPLYWTDTTQFPVQVDELYRALMVTFAPSKPVDATNCLNHDCVSGRFGDVGYILFQSVGISLWTPNLNQPAPVIDRVDVFKPNYFQ